MHPPRCGHFEHALLAHLSLGAQRVVDVDLDVRRDLVALRGRQRDAQRRTRRMAAIAFASVFGMTVMSILTVMAVHSRSEAQSQRAQAEDLIEFMLGDLRKKLEPVGRLDVLDLVGEKALAYYANQSRDRLDATSLGRHSRATHLIGELREQRGQLEGALAAFQSAAGVTSGLT